MALNVIQQTRPVAAAKESGDSLGNSTGEGVSFVERSLTIAGLFSTPAAGPLYRDLTGGGGRDPDHAPTVIGCHIGHMFQNLPTWGLAGSV